MDDKVLINYAKYLALRLKDINKHSENSGIFYQLKQFYETGKIKDLIFNTDTLSTKLEMLSIFYKSIEEFRLKNHPNSPKILDYEIFYELTIKQ